MCQHTSAKSPSSFGWLYHELDSAPFHVVGEPWCHGQPLCCGETINISA